MATSLHSRQSTTHLSHSQSPHASTSRQPSTPSPFSPHENELHPGPRNRLFLALRSGVPSEVDWALPRLVVGSYEHPERFKLELWVDSISALIYWPGVFISQLEKSSIITGVRNGTIASKKRKLISALIPEWTDDPVVEKRATESLLVVRNCSFIPNNAILMCRESLLDLIERFFQLPYDCLLETTVKYPEFTSHLLSIIQGILPNLKSPSSSILSIFAEILPKLLVDTRDNAMINHILPILIHVGSLPNLPPIPTDLIPHILNLITLTPPTPLLELLLDLLFVLSSNSTYCRQILTHPNFPGYIKNLIPLLEYGAKPYLAMWDPKPHLMGKTVRNPASGTIQAVQAMRRRGTEREAAQRVMAETNGEGVFNEVGEHPPVLSQSTRNLLYTLPEPQRSITWMHETFVYSSSSQLPQVTFWHAYKDFFQHPSTVEQLYSASEVIKNVTVAFPGAAAKIWMNPQGEQKFVIAGMGFRKGTDDDDRFVCRWRGCPIAAGFQSPLELYDHIQTFHFNASPPPSTCEWASCTRPNTPQHILTHLPSIKRPDVPEMITIHPSTPEHHISYSKITNRLPPPLPRNVKLAFTGKTISTDANRQPTGTPFLTALIIRNLAKTLRLEISLDTQDFARKEEKKKHLVEERFGLPIPESILKEEEEEENVASKEDIQGMIREERDRAIMGFRNIEERLLDVVEGNMNQLGKYLGDAFGW